MRRRFETPWNCDEQLATGGMSDRDAAKGPRATKPLEEPQKLVGCSTIAQANGLHQAWVSNRLRHLCVLHCRSIDTWLLCEVTKWSSHISLAFFLLGISLVSIGCIRKGKSIHLFVGTLGGSHGAHSWQRIAKIRVPCSIVHVYQRT